MPEGPHPPLRGGRVVNRFDEPLTESEALPGLRVLHARGQWLGTIVRVEWPTVWVDYAMDAGTVPAVPVPAAALRRTLRLPPHSPRHGGAMTIERIFKGPLFVHPGLVSCAVCHYGIEDGELVLPR